MSDEARDFYRHLVTLKLLTAVNEAAILAMTHRDRMGRPKWDVVTKVCATRAAHKKEMKQ